MDTPLQSPVVKANPREHLFVTCNLIEPFARSGDTSTVSALVKGYKQRYTDTLLLPSITTELSLARFITACPIMIEMKNMIRVLVNNRCPVLIYGETGTGKEIVADALHGDRPGPFMAINCAGLPEHLIESELFGHERGSFTGAVAEKKGLFEVAQDGTVFLDEIGELPLILQAKLLRVLQERKIRRVGGSEERNINCRVISATHQNLEQEILEGKFRSDLYHRISTFTVTTLPLRLRRDDVRLIMRDMLTEEELSTEELERMDIGDEHLGGNVRDVQKWALRWLHLGKREWKRKE